MDATSAAERTVCRCSDPLPKQSGHWLCGGCGGQRRYMEKISVGRGGVVARCGECRYDAVKRREPESSVALGLCRFVTCTTLMAGEYRSIDTYSLCDACADAEIRRNSDADIFDGRETTAVVAHAVHEDRKQHQQDQG